MARPLLLAVEDDPEQLSLMRRELANRYGKAYRVASVATAREGLRLLADAAATGREVALVLANMHLSGEAGPNFFAEARALHLEARCVALINWRGQAEGFQGELYKAAAARLIDDWIVEPWSVGDEHFHQAIGNFLYQWWRDHRPDLGWIRIVGESWSTRAHEIRDLLSRRNFRFDFVDVASEEGRELLDQFHLDHPRLPLVIAWYQVFENPSNAEIAQAFGLQTRAPSARYDVTIIGSGPAGLAAAVYGASEGLRTLVVERDSVGGQAGASSSIRNYLGFSRGISGGELAARAFEQARMFGVDFVYGEAVGLDWLQQDRVITLRDGGTVTSRAVIIATGAAYRRLGIEALEAFTGSGVFYGATASEAETMQGEAVHVVGGANSAGQAALHLAGHASRVTLIVRGSVLAQTMSDYLIRAIKAAPNITVRCGTEVVDGAGDRRLSQLTLRDTTTGATENVSSNGVFVMIGAEPHTSWLPQSIQRDPWGYLFTGTDLQTMAPTDPARPTPLPFETSMPGVFAVGDVRHGSGKRVAASVGDGSVAVRLLHEYLAQLGEQDEKTHAGF